MSVTFCEAVSECHWIRRAVWQYPPMYTCSSQCYFLLIFTQIKLADSNRAEKLFNPICYSVTSELSSSRLLSLLGDSKRRVSQGLMETEMKAKKQLLTDGSAKAENVGKAGLVYYPEQVLNEIMQVCGHCGDLYGVGWDGVGCSFLTWDDFAGMKDVGTCRRGPGLGRLSGVGVCTERSAKLRM